MTMTNNNLKNLTIEFEGVERNLQYMIKEYGSGYYTTDFYEGKTAIQRKKYWLFGPMITEYEPKYIFIINRNIYWIIV